MIAGFDVGLGFDYCWSRSRTKNLGRQPVLVSKKLSGLGLGLALEVGGLDYNTGNKALLPTCFSILFF